MISIATHMIGTVSAAQLAAGDSARWFEQIGRMHMAIVHFPIALLLVAGMIELFRAMLRKDRPSTTAIVCLSIGAVTASVAAVAGWYHQKFTGYANDSAMKPHQYIGFACAAVAKSKKSSADMVITLDAVDIAATRHDPSHPDCCACPAGFRDLVAA